LWNWNELAANQVGASYPNRTSEPVLHHAYVLCRAAFSPVSYQPNGGPTRAPEITVRKKEPMKTLMTLFTGIMLIGCTGADHQASDGSHIPAVTDSLTLRLLFVW